MKSIFVTLLSALMIYAGYIFHPVVHRIGNDMSARLKKEFTPVSSQLTTAKEASAKKPVRKPIKLNAQPDVTNEIEDKPAEPAVTEKESEPEKPIEAEKVPDSPTNIAENGKIPPKKPTVPISRPINIPKPPSLPPEYSLIEAIKHGIDVTNHPEKYAITNEDKRLGQQLQQLKEKFDKKYNNLHLTVAEIKQLKEEYQKEFSKIAKNFGMTEKQLTIFDSVFFNK